MREWEATHLPTYGTQAGYSLFLELASTRDRKTRKEIYLSMSCAESTTRLLLRNLESDGWIQLTRDPQDRRFRAFQPTDKFSALVDEWLGFVVSRLVQASLHLDLPGLEAAQGRGSRGIGVNPDTGQDPPT